LAHAFLSSKTQKQTFSATRNHFRSVEIAVKWW
jgi:hypothetical protein